MEIIIQITSLLHTLALQEGPLGPLSEKMTLVMQLFI
jgi:hypothetical protein